MKRLLSLVMATALLSGFGFQSPAQGDVFELRIYTAREGTLEKLNARFRDHTVRLFEKHGIENVGYWVPVDEPKSKNTLIYVIKHKSREAAKESWAAFLADPEWKKAAAESGVGRLAARPESIYMTATDYSPNWKSEASKENAEDAVFELRIYKAAEGKLGKLDARFRDHTMRIFEKHGIKSVAYWHPTEEPGASDTLIYIIRHASREAAKKSWRAFGADPEWHKAATESGVGRLAKRPDVTYMKATDYSAIR